MFRLYNAHFNAWSARFIYHDLSGHCPANDYVFVIYDGSN